MGCIGRAEHILAHTGTSIVAFGRTCQAQHDSSPDGLRTDCGLGPMKGPPATEAHVQPWPVPCSSSPRNSALTFAAWLVVVCAVHSLSSVLLRRLSPALAHKRAGLRGATTNLDFLRALPGLICTCHEDPSRLPALDAPHNQATSYPDRFPAEHTVSPCCHTSCPPSGPLRTSLSFPTRSSASSTGTARRSLSA